MISLFSNLSPSRWVLVSKQMHKIWHVDWQKIQRIRQGSLPKNLAELLSGKNLNSNLLNLLSRFRSLRVIATTDN